MNPAQGQCALCGATNSYTKVACDKCGARLPWADAVQPKTPAPAPAPAPQIVTPPTTQQPTAPQSPTIQGAPANTADAANKTLVGCVGCGCVVPMLLFFLLWIIGIMGGGSKAGEGVAYVAARMAIERQLKAPATAKFPHSFDSGVTIRENGDTFTISSYVDSQNSFGAMIRTRWVAEVQRTADGKDVRVVSAELLE